MKGKIALLVLVALIMSAAGFVFGTYLMAQQSKLTDSADNASNPKEVLYKLPLGRFTVQVIKPEEFLNIRFKMDVFITGATNFERMNDGISRSRMREEVMQHLSNMAETTLWAEDLRTVPLDPSELASNITNKLYQQYPMVRTAQILEFSSAQVDR
jgi:hypothetical protein